MVGQIENLITEAVAGAEQEHRLVFELIGTHIGAVHPRVMRGYGHDHVLFIDLLGHEACVGERVGGDGHINLPERSLLSSSEVKFSSRKSGILGVATVIALMSSGRR